MSVFVFDHDATDMIRYILAIQHFNMYSVGPQGLEDYLSVLTLEKVLIQTGLKFPKFQKENQREIRLHDIIRFLQQKSLVSPIVASNLNIYLDFHDSLMSQRTTTQKPKSKAKEILQFLCTEAGINQNEEQRNRTFEEIATLRTEQSTEDNSDIVESDFDNFDKLAG